MKNRGLTLIEILLCIAVLGIIGGVLVQNVPAMVRTTRGATQTVQTASIARAYMEHIRTQWSTKNGNSITLSSINTLVGTTSNITGTLNVQSRDTDGEALTPITTPSPCSIVGSSCGVLTNAKSRWLFTLTLNVTDGAATPTILSTQQYVMELGR